MTTPEQARRDQLAYGRSTLRMPEGFERGGLPRPAHAVSRLASKPGPKGHEAILKAMQDNAQKVTIITADGAKFEGTVTGRDKYTITLKTPHPDGVLAGDGRTILRVFFKSAIEQLWGEQAPRRNEADETAVQ